MAWLRFLVGFLLTIGLFLGLAEGFLRLFPPRDLQPFLGEQSGLSGVYQPDADVGVTYRSFEDFARENARALKRWLPLNNSNDGQAIWAMFGNSFIQAPGMLADTLHRQVADKRIFHLRRNEFLWLRLAQVQLLLDHGLQPERIIFAVMIVDMPIQQPLDHLVVTSHGALTYRPNCSDGIMAYAIQNSRLAMTAWCRSGLHQPLPMFDRKQLHHTMPATLASDLERLFAALARSARKHDVPVTILLIPSFEQVCRGEPFVFQDQLTLLCHDQHLDVCDVRQDFLNQSDKTTLFIPDKHFSETGNQILLNALLKHFEIHSASRREDPR